jgi:hypothetical protein
MMEDDSLRNLLREWKAPEAPPTIDAEMRSAYRAAYPPPPRWNFWSARISLPAPMFAVLMLVMLALVLQFRSEPPAVTRGGHVYVTHVDAEGFQPLPNGAARVVRLEGISQ